MGLYGTKTTLRFYCFEGALLNSVERDMEKIAKPNKFWGGVFVAPVAITGYFAALTLLPTALAVELFIGKEANDKYSEFLEGVYDSIANPVREFGSKHGDLINETIVKTVVGLVLSKVIPSAKPPHS